MTRDEQIQALTAALGSIQGRSPLNEIYAQRLYDEAEVKVAAAETRLTDEQWQHYMEASRKQAERIEKRNARVTLSNDRLRAKKMLKEWRRNGSLKNPDLTVDDILKEQHDA